MPRGGGASRRQRGFLIWSLIATPACGLVVGFEPRDLCDDCADSSDAIGSGGTTSSGGAASAGSTTAAGGSEGNAEGLGTVETASGTGGSASGSGGSTANGGGTAGSDTGGGGNASGGSSTGSGGSSAGGSAGGTNTFGGATSTDSGGAGGQAVNGNTGGTNTDAGGMGGTDAGGATSGGGSGGDVSSMTATATSAGGATSSGGTGSGGSGGTPSPCTSEEPFDLTQDTGTHPAALRLGINNSSRLWDFSWVEGNDVYVAARSSSGSALLAPKLLDDSGTHSASVIATHGQYAYVAYGEFASGNPRIVMRRLNPLDADDVVPSDTGTLDGEAAPRVVGVTHRGSTSDMLVAAITSDDSGLLALFRDGQFVTSLAVPGSFDDLTPLDLGESFAIAYIEGGALQVALVPYDLSNVELAEQVADTSPIAPALGSLSGTATDDGAALVWLETNGVYVVSLDEDGAAVGSPIPVAAGANRLPKVDVLGAHLFVSWIDASSGTLYLRRVPSDLSGSAELPLAVEDGVAEVRYGFAADTFSSDPTLALVYSTDRLRMSIVTCR